MCDNSCLVLTALAAALVAGAGGRAEGDPPEDRQQFEARWRTIKQGRRLVKDRPADRFVPVDYEDLPRGIKTNLKRIYVGILRPDALPKRYTGGDKTPTPPAPGDAQVRAYAAGLKGPGGREDDLVELTWAVEGVPVRSVVSRNGMLLQVRLEDLEHWEGSDGEGTPAGGEKQDGARRAALARAFVDRHLRLTGERPLVGPYEIRLPWPDELRDGISFSSAPEENILFLGYWTDRVDAFVEDGTLSILFYLKIPQLAGYQDGSQWFPEEFAQEILRRQEEAPPAKPGDGQESPANGT